MAIESEKVTIIIRVHILLCSQLYKLVYPLLVPLSGHPMNNSQVHTGGGWLNNDNRIANIDCFELKFLF